MNIKKYTSLSISYANTIELSACTYKKSAWVESWQDCSLPSWVWKAAWRPPSLCAASPSSDIQRLSTALPAFHQRIVSTNGNKYGYKNRYIFLKACKKNWAWHYICIHTLQAATMLDKYQYYYFLYSSLFLRLLIVKRCCSSLHLFVVRS